MPAEVVKLNQLVLLVSEPPDITVISHFANADGERDDVALDSSVVPPGTASFTGG